MEEELAKRRSDQLLSIDLHSSKQPASSIKRSHTHLRVFTKQHKPHQNCPQNSITTPQVIVHRTTWYSAVCGFIIKKPHKPHPLYILIYLIIFNIKYIINSLITLVFKKKKKKSSITLASVD